MGKGISLSIVSLLLLMLIPVSAAPHNQIVTENIEYIGKEYSVVFEHDITYLDWLQLENEGFVPLRQISKNEMLIWVNGDGPNLKNTDLKNLKELNNELLIDVEKLYFSEYRVLLEPHLPSEGVTQVLTELDRLNLEIKTIPLIKDVGAIPTSFKISGVLPINIDIDGIWKIENVLETTARNDVAASIIEGGSLDEHKLWERGLNGEGVLIAVADTGLDLDHACFRDNSTTIGEPGDNHRKIQILNTTLDSWDSSNNSDFGHGTHIAGSLSCDWIEGEQRTGTSLSYNSRLIVQDIVSEAGWIPPENVEVLFLEAAQNGAVIHSDSWGDTEVNYTERSGRFDGWGREVPWSLIFVAPGNSGGQLMEPANARNVIAVGSTTKSGIPEMVSSSSVGPTTLGTRGIFLVAPGKYIVSADSDGIQDSFNEGTSSLSGTSMSTPLAASGAAIIQQMVELGLFNSKKINNNSSGFTPSGPLMKSLLSLSTTSIEDSTVPNSEQGWGILNISEIIPNDFFENENNTIDNIWIWDSYQYDGDWSAFTSSRIENNDVPLESLTKNVWDGSDAKGPFLSTGDEIIWNFTINREEDIQARLSWLAKPEPYLVDDLRLSIITSDGRIAYSNNFDSDGYSELYSEDSNSFSSDNETTVGINLNLEDLVGVDWIHVVVKGDYVGVGNSPNSIGIEGDRVGFGLAIKGIVEEAPLELGLGGFEEITVEHVLGYTYVGAGGAYEQIDFGNPKTLSWDFDALPGSLNVELSVDAPRNLSVNLTGNPFGFRTISGMGDDAVLPICSEDNDTITAVNSNARKWTVTGIWWPPLLIDCKGNNMDFDLDSKRLDAPEPLKRWREWVEENNKGEYIAVETSWDLSNWETPWVEGELVPERLSCEFRFDFQSWGTCDVFETEIIPVPKTATKFEIKLSWIEINGLSRILIVEHSIPQYQIRDFPQLSIEYLKEDQNKLSLIGNENGGVPLILFSDSRSHAFFDIVNKSWDIGNLSISCEGEEFWIMGIDSEGITDFNIGNNAEILNDADLKISALIIGSTNNDSESMKPKVYWDGLLDNDAGVFLWLENSIDGHDVALQLKSFDMLELYGSCAENSQKSANPMLEGLFWMWILLTGIILISGVAAWKKQHDLIQNSSDEES